MNTPTRNLENDHLYILRLIAIMQIVAMHSNKDTVYIVNLEGFYHQ
jgi:hypothetical protein